jgi:hypothetical protein
MAGFATGRLDALITIIGVGAGSLLFAVLFPILEGFYLSSDMGQTTLPKLAGVNNWVIIGAVAAFALGMFLLMEWHEKKKDGHSTQREAFQDSVGDHAVINTH